MMYPRQALLCSLLLVAVSQGAAQTMQDYRCKIERVASAESPRGKLLVTQAKSYVGKEFIVDRRTGVMNGALRNSYITRPEVIDHGSADNSFKAVTTLRKEQGAGRGSNAYLLVINEFQLGPEKPFLFAENSMVYFGNCTHF